MSPFRQAKTRKKPGCGPLFVGFYQCANDRNQSEFACCYYQRKSAQILRTFNVDIFNIGWKR
jgi:hypothetical protein